MGKLRIYSGSCLMGDVGAPADEVDMNGNELFVGDIVQLWHGNYIGTDLEEWLPSDGLTAIVTDKYTSYTSNGSDILHKITNEKPRAFTMGIFDIGVKGGCWDVRLVKSHKDIVSGERIKSFGFKWIEGDRDEY